MARASLYPGFIRILYTGNGHVHKATIPVRPTLDAGTWKLTKNDGTFYSPWTAAVDAYVLLLKAFLNTADEVQTAQLWTLASGDADPLYVADHAIAAAGTSAVAAVPNGQATLIFRLDSGGLLKLHIMESSSAANIHTFPPFGAGSVENLRAHVMGAATGFFIGRDGGIPTSCTSFTTKVNDKLRRKFLLAT